MKFIDTSKIMLSLIIGAELGIAAKVITDSKKIAVATMIGAFIFEMRRPIKIKIEDKGVNISYE